MIDGLNFFNHLDQEISAKFLSMETMLFIGSFLALGFLGASVIFWGAWLLLLEGFVGAPHWLDWITVAALLIATIPILRSLIVSQWVMKLMKALKVVPRISATEKTAIEAGGSWVESEFFKGKPDFNVLLDQVATILSEQEVAFLNHQVEVLCQMVDDWKIWKSRDIPPEVWEYLKTEKFFGIIIPKSFGGLGFSPSAHSAIIQKIASKSFVVAVYVMVPNSLGPAELLLAYGTEKQKSYYLPRLANGVEIPSFALTEAEAGSDAGNIQSYGVLFKKGDSLFVRFFWNKRYISLAKVSTLLGLAFRLKDPENLLGKGEDLGITCALIPTDSPGVTIEDRHDPLGVPFYNCPVRGQGVEVSADCLIGGFDQAGHGWRMLMECLSAGRGISFPAQMAGSSQLSLAVVIPYVQVREQFGVSLGQFEGVQEPLARIAAHTYVIEAARSYILNALDQGIKPAVASAISKYQTTEYGRKVINDAMDVCGGAGISLGPRNKLAHFYLAAPISITVEGANILTRTLMIFGQGAFRAHPFAFDEIDAIEHGDIFQFDRAFWGHVLHTVKNAFRVLLLYVTRGWLDHRMGQGREGKFLRRISWASASFALLTDLSMAIFGGELKVKESLTGRFADVLSNLYLSSAVIKKYRTDGRRDDDWPLVNHVLADLMHQTQRYLENIYQNYEAPLFLWFWKGIIRPLSMLNPLHSPPLDSSGKELVLALMSQPNTLARLTSGIYLPKNGDDHLIELQEAAELSREVAPVIQRIHLYFKRNRQKRQELSIALLNHLVHSSEITPAESSALERWMYVKEQVILVDEFTEAEYHSRSNDVTTASSDGRFPGLARSSAPSRTQASRDKNAAPSRDLS